MDKSFDAKYSSASSEILTEDRDVVYAKCHFPKYFRSATFFGHCDLKSLMFSGQDPFDSHKILRKYSIKKTVSATCFGTQLSKLSHQKLKELKNLRLVVPTQRIKPHIGLKRLSVSDIYIFVKPSKMKAQQICKNISACKRLEFLELNMEDRTFSLKEIRKLRTLTSVKLKLSEKQLLKDLGYLFQLKKLEKVDITIEGIHTDKSKEKEVRLLEFLLQLIQQNKKLKAFRLNLLQTSGYSLADFLVPLLIELNKSHIEFWDLQVKSVEYNEQDIFELSKHLSKIDFLGLTVEEFQQNTGRVIRNFMPRKIYREKEVTHIVQKRQKILDICLSKNCIIRLSALLNGTSSLKGIYLSLLSESADIQLFGPLPCLETLQNAILRFRELEESEVSDISVPLIRMLKSSKCLESLSLIHRDRKAKPGDFLGRYMNEMTGMSSLTKLQINMTSSKCNTECTKTMLESMPALKELNIHLYHRDKAGEKTHLSLLIPYDKLKSLTKLRLTLYESFGKEDILYLMENIGNLSNLEKLFFIINCKISQELFEDLMQKLSGLGKLKALILEPQADLKTVNEDFEEKIPNFWGSRDQVARMISSNSNLKKISVSLGPFCNLGYTKYC